MSTEIKKDIVCPACGQTQKLEMYTSVNAEENPELRRDILRESIFDWECRHCGYTAQMAYPMIYHDPAHGFMVCLRPSGAVSKAEPIPAVRGLIKRSVKNPQELKEKILIFEAGLDDAAVELVKNAIVTVLKRSIEGNVHAYFCAADENEMRFAIFVRGRQDPVYQTTQMAVYRQSQEVLRTLDYKEPLRSSTRSSPSAFWTSTNPFEFNLHKKQRRFPAFGAALLFAGCRKALPLQAAEPFFAPYAFISRTKRAWRRAGRRCWRTSRC